MFEKLRLYQPVNEQEAIDKKAMLQFIEHNKDVLYRTNLIAHMTSSAIVMNQSMDKVLFAHHNIYNSWGWVGGHNDGDPDCLHVALKEAKEECNLILGQGCILIVDDESMVRLVLNDMLESLGYEILLAEDGKQGVELYKTW